MDLPHLNVLTKIDKLSTYEELPFNLDFYTEVQDLTYLFPYLESESQTFHKKFKALNEKVVDLVQDFGLVGFETLAVEDKKSMMHLLQIIDRAGGYAFGGAEGANDTVWQIAMREGTTTMDVKDIQERWLDAKDEYDAHEREQWAAEAKARDEAHEADRPKKDSVAEIDGITVPPGGSGIKVVRK